MIVKENGNQLILIPNGFEVFFPLLFKIVPYGFLAIMLLIATAKESMVEAIIALIVIALVGWIFLLIADENSIYHAIFDKDTQKITLVFRSSASLWFPRRRKLEFEKLAALVLNHVGEKGFVFYLLLKSGTEFPFAGTASAECAEQVSRFLRIPLKIQMENESITHMPWVSDREMTPFPTPCAKCGAPLPTIEPGMMNAKCSHCGMTMVISWSEGRISYKAQG